MIPVSCPCGASYRVPDDKAGLTFTCKKCRQPVLIQQQQAATAGGDSFLAALGELERNAPDMIREMDRKDYKKLSIEIAERTRMEEAAAAAKLEEMSRLAVPNVGGAIRQRGSNTAAAGNDRKSPGAKLSESGTTVSVDRSVASELRNTLISRLFLHPAIICGIVAYMLYDKAGNAIKDVTWKDESFSGLREFSYSAYSSPTFQVMGGMILMSTLVISLCWLIRGWGRVANFPEAVKAYTVFTTLFLWAAAVFMWLLPWECQGDESAFLTVMRWLALGMLGLTVLWGITLVAAEDGFLLLLACCVPPYWLYCLIFGRPASRMVLVGTLGAAFVVYGITWMGVVYSAEFPSEAAAVEAMRKQEEDRLAAIEASQWKNSKSTVLPPLRIPEQDKPSDLPIVVPNKAALPPSQELQPIQGAQGEAAIKSLAKGKFVHADKEVSLLGDYVSEGAFEFRPPKGFERHTLPSNPKAVRWDASGVKPGENTMMILTYPRESGSAIDGYFTSDGSNFQFTRDGSRMNLDQRDGSRFDHNNLTLLRFMPQVGGMSPQGLSLFHAFVIDQDFIIHVQASMKQEMYFVNRKLLEASIATMRRRH